MRIVSVVRRELRIHDNPLWQGANEHEIVPLFVLDEFNQREHGDNLRTLFFFALNELRKQISSLGGHLYCIRTEQQEAFFATVKPDVVRFCEDHEPHSRERDSNLMRLLERIGIRYEVLRDSTLTPIPEQPFSTFTQFYKRHFLPTLQNNGLPHYPIPKHFKTPKIEFVETELPQVSSEAAKSWCIGEKEVLNRWRHYVRQHLANYEHTRNFLTETSSSRISPYIRCGLISLRQLCRDALDVSDAFVRELAWHDFYAHLLHHFPETTEQEWRLEWRRFRWRQDEKDFERWCQGQTGVPLVDAGMRQLQTEGWLPNRVRMVVASFLTKHLRIDWRWGERYFYCNLVDADLAQNVGNWQWVAGCGADAAPYFRIFNPILQAQKFDPQGEYIRKFVPELRKVPTEALFDLTKLRNCAPNYPTPMVDLEVARSEFQAEVKKHFGEKGLSQKGFD
ncbi:MAG: DNA photolyase family protein [Armatimonadetes bacterium]|nr:DNA photolyase family protein [Armatimonadota bacterium]MDW8028349.1 deoxyribodipyrimidine photo-lyase [Armatimonadota bacterium]